MPKPIIIGQMGINDSGKSVLVELMGKNIPEHIYFCFNKGQQLFEQRMEFIKRGTDDLEYMLQFFGSNNSSLSEFYRDIKDKEKLRELLSQITDKEYVLIQITPSEFDRYCDYGFFTYRDFRACWFVTAHWPEGLFEYISKNMGIYRQFKNIINKRKVLPIQFEELIQDQSFILNQIFQLIGLDYGGKKSRLVSEKYSHYMTKQDIGNIRQGITNEQLEIVSALTRDYGIEMKYRHTMSVDGLIK